MADDLRHHGLTVELGAELADKVRVFAAAARGAVRRHFDDWSETMERSAQYDRDGLSIGVDEPYAYIQRYRVEPDRVIVARVFHSREDRG